MNNIIIEKSTAKFDVFTINKKPEVGDKWEGKRNIYTITGVKRLYLTYLPLDGVEYYLVYVDVWAKDICNPDEPETILMKYDPYDLYDPDVLLQLEKELEEERIKNKDFHDYKKVYEE